MAKQTKITIETLSLLMLQGRISRWAWCPRCGAEREVLALGETRVISNLESLEVRELLNSSGLHRWQTADRSELICLNSLLAIVRNTKCS